MFYRCKNCGGNVLYDPDKKKMVCDSCQSEDSAQLIRQEKFHICNNCGGQLEVGEHTLAARCPYCKTSIILEDRMEEAYEPHLVLPFQIDKHKAAEFLLKKFKGKLFLPANFCSASSLESMEGIYVPFWMYDFHTSIYFEGEGDKIRVWREGDYECTETRVYRIIRDFTVDYERIPVDASISRENGLMDLIEPYQYGSLFNFSPEFLSGFEAETWEEDKEQLRDRAEQKANTYSEQYLNDFIGNYDAVRSFQKKRTNEGKETNYAFLPMWHYVYHYNGKNYEFYVNGQTGKAIGSAPVSIGKAFAMSAAVFGSVFFFLRMLCFFLEVI